MTPAAKSLTCAKHLNLLQHMKCMANISIHVFKVHEYAQMQIPYMCNSNDQDKGAAPKT